MKNEKGITLIELLAAVVIAGLVIVPLLTIMTGTVTRTASQDSETKISYVAQEVMEKIRLYSPDTELPTSYSDDDGKKHITYCFQETNPIYLQKGISCINELPTIYATDITINPSEQFITVEFSEYESERHPENPIYKGFYVVTITVFEDTKVINGGENSSVSDKENSIKLVTVVEL